MAINPSDLTSFATTGQEAQLSGQGVDLDFQMQQLPGMVKGVDKIKATDIAIRNKPLTSKGLGVEDEENDEDTTTDALTALRRSVANVSSTPTKFDVTPDLEPVSGNNYAFSTNNVSDMKIPTNIGLLTPSQGMSEGLKDQKDEYYDYLDELSSSLAQPPEGPPEGVATARTVSSVASSLTQDPKTGEYIAKGIKFFNPDSKITGAQVSKTAGQIAAGAGTIVSAYSAYDALKGGIDSPMEGLQAIGGVAGTIAGLGQLGVITNPALLSAAGPIGWAVAGATLLYSSGLIGGRGKNKPPMGGVEFRLVDDAGKQYSNVQEGQKRRIKAVNPHSYNGFNSSALLSQANKNVDYLYAFADEFDLKVNEKAWAQAAFGGDGVNKYMPRGREAPYRSVLERIDSMGDGSKSPTEWLRHAMEYEGPNGERIIEGDIYKGVRIGPNGMPMKVGYKTQEEFQEAVADFNKRFYG